MKSQKGGQFEREISKTLSKWWTLGERDDVFWRVSQSGGRATQRMKTGRRTYGSYGDIAAVDPIGEPLLSIFTIELKRGRSHGSPFELVENAPSQVLQPFQETLLQAYRSHQDARSIGWLLICRRDFKAAMVYADWGAVRYLELEKKMSRPPCCRFRVTVPKVTKPFAFVGMPLETFLREVRPSDIAR